MKYLAIVFLVIACGGGATDACAACGTFTRYDPLVFGYDTIQLKSDLTFSHGWAASGVKGASAGRWKLNASAFSMQDSICLDAANQPVWFSGTFSGNTLSINAACFYLNRTYSRAP